MHKQISATDITAFAVVELNVPIPIDVFYNMSVEDELYKSLLDAWTAKEKRLDSRNALICATIANCMSSGGKKYELDDFMPKYPKSSEQEEAELKAAFLQYEMLRKEGLVKQ